jgi:predicted alpha/beta-fold hydrolase
VSDWETSFDFVAHKYEEVGIDFEMYAIGISMGSNVLLNYLG